MKGSVMYRQYGRDALYKTWHTSPQHSILYFYSDGGSIVFNDRIYTIRRGTLIFFVSGCYHYTMPDHPERYERSKLFLAPEDWDAVLAPFAELAPMKKFSSRSVVYAQIPEEFQGEIDRLFVQIRDAGAFHGTAPLVFSGVLLQLIAYLDKFAVESLPAPSDFTTKGLDYINRHIAEDLTVEAICEAIPISKYYFCRQFKRATGLTVMEYILKTRITLAKNMLRKEKLSVSEISTACGFCSVSYFCRIFKENTGMTALAYRNHKD